jgi:hypothetical protein
MKPDIGLPPTGPLLQTVQLAVEPMEDEGEGRWRVPSTFSAALVSLDPSGYTHFNPEPYSVPVSFTPGVGQTQFGTFSNGKITLEVNLNSAGNIPMEQLFFAGQEKVQVWNDYNGIGINPGKRKVIQCRKVQSLIVFSTVRHVLHI